MSFIIFTTRMSLFITVLVYVLLDNKITAEKVFMVTAYYNILRTTMTVFFPQGISRADFLPIIPTFLSPFRLSISFSSLTIFISCSLLSIFVGVFFLPSCHSSRELNYHDAISIYQSTLLRVLRLRRVSRGALEFLCSS